MPVEKRASDDNEEIIAKTVRGCGSYLRLVAIYRSS
jgi:hypothetical protein